MKYLVYFLFCLMFIEIQAQSLDKQTLSNGGGFSENGNLSLEWTFGEMSVLQLTNGNLVLTAGFHQGDDLFVGFIEVEDFRLNVFPNPSRDQIQLELMNASNKDFTIQLFDLKGSKMLEKEVFHDGSVISEVDLSPYESGVYVLILVDIISGNTYEWKVQKIN